MFVSVTRLSLRSLRFVRRFQRDNAAIIAQIVGSAGFVAYCSLRRRSVTWTMTGWDDEAAMHAFIRCGAHRSAMPRIQDWSDEATYTHWLQDSPILPDWRGGLAACCSPAAVPLAPAIGQSHPRQH